MELKIFHRLHDMTREAWSQIAPQNFPFASYDFLKAMEDGGCVGVGTGWLPRYLTLWNSQGLQGAVYLYVREDSNGEFIFDWEWADAYARHGLHYYPKLISAVPFTPATGPKLLVRDGGALSQIRAQLIEASWKESIELDTSGLHFLFIPSEEISSFAAQGFLIRHTHQYHWDNPGYRDFEDFLAGLKRKRRLQILRERRQVQASGIEIVLLQGEQIQMEHIEAIYRFYLHTHGRHGGYAYLTREFFQCLHQTLRDRILLVLARDGGAWVAGSINFFQGDSIFGRYWGCLARYKNLHFELCYYRQIEWAIERRLRHFEAGAQGGHKINRGLDPVLTYSAHRLRHPVFHRAIGEAIEREKQGLALGLENFKGHGAYRSSR